MRRIYRLPKQARQPLRLRHAKVESVHQGGGCPRPRSLRLFDSQTFCFELVYMLCADVEEALDAHLDRFVLRVVVHEAGEE